MDLYWFDYISIAIIVLAAWVWWKQRRKASSRFPLRIPAFDPYDAWARHAAKVIADEIDKDILASIYLAAGGPRKTQEPPTP